MMYCILQLRPHIAVTSLQKPSAILSSHFHDLQTLLPHSCLGVADIDDTVCQHCTLLNPIRLLYVKGVNLKTVAIA